jgi:DNA helicase-2/ATP-dependent DNA helicase PcrA
MKTNIEPLYKLFDQDSRLTNGNLQIIACAGAGKTEFISARVAYLIAKAMAKPENIVAFTFTERAAKELKFRIRGKIRELIGHQPDIGDIYVGTIHSFCFELLKEFFPGYRGYDVLDEGKRYAFISSIRNEIGLYPLLNWLQKNFSKPYGMTKESWAINTFIRNVDIVREEMLRPEDVSACPEFANSLETYDKILKERRFLDFSGMMAHAVRHLTENPQTLMEVKNRFTHITVDEYQDINPIQERLINLLAGKDGNLCVVGDDDQSIYQWRGTTIENILTFQKRYNNVYTHRLPINYRSTDGIITLGNKLIAKNIKRLKKSMNTSGKMSEHGDIYKIDFKTQQEEISFIVDRIKHIIGTKWTEKDGHERGLAYSDIAIFFRSVRFGSRPYLDALTEAGIPYAVSGIGGLFDTPEVDVVFSIFSYLGDFEKDNGSVPTEESIYRYASKTFKLPKEVTFSNSLKDFKEELKNKRRISLQQVYADILVLLGINREERHDLAYEVEMYNLGRLSQVISDYEGTRTYCTYKDINRLCWFIIHFAEGAYDAGYGEDPTLLINAVQVMTLHATKGLGFPVVFMPYCVERPYREAPPGFLDPETFNFTRYQGSIEDERRLFYVGITRAKKFLYVTASRDLGPRKRKKSPLKFFDELDNSYCVTTPKPDPTRRKKLPSKPYIEDYQFPTSYSELSDYIRCEYDYKMRYIYGFNPIIVQALGYGKQVHNILNILHN